MADGVAVLGEPRPAPFLVPPTVSLLTAVDVIIDETDERWYAGISYSPEGCSGGEVKRICADDAKTAASGRASITHRPYLLVASDKASTFGYTHRDFVARATRKLIACESKLLEAELMSATVEVTNQSVALDNLGAAGDGPTVVSGAGNPAPHRALAWIEQALADCGCGGRSLIHMRPKVFESLHAQSPSMLRRDGNRWLTPLDNVVVPGRGYPGTGPTGQAVAATEWIYATPMIQIHRGPLVVTPNSIAEATKRDTNYAIYYAERVVATDWDTTCCRFALEVTP